MYIAQKIKKVCNLQRYFISYSTFLQHKLNYNAGMEANEPQGLFCCLKITLGMFLFVAFPQ